MFKDYYCILGISPYASLSEIKEAYRVASKKWHPDLNKGVDTTQMMQDVNEAYAILKDEVKRKRYDAEYVLFSQKKTTFDSSSQTQSTDKSWSYDYDITDENLKEDINSARQYAKDLVDEFLASFKENAKKAATGAWEGAKGYIIGYVIAAIILSIIGLRFALRSGMNHEVNIVTPKIQSADVHNVEVGKEQKISSNFQKPKNWTEYEIDGSFKISIPPIVELRHEHDNYTKQLDSMHLNLNKDAVIFQQKNLSNGANDDHYCRIMFQHFVGEDGDFMKSNETEFLDHEWNKTLTDMVNGDLFGMQTLLDTPTFKWINVNEKTKAIEVVYRRSGNNDNTTHVTIYLLQNYNEMVKMIVSYRETEKELWLPDLDNVIKTYKWKSNK